MRLPTIAAGIALALVACSQPPADPKDQALGVVKAHLPEWDKPKVAWGEMSRDEQGHLYQEAERDSHHRLRIFSENGRLAGYSFSYLTTEDPTPYVETMLAVASPTLDAAARAKAQADLIAAAKTGDTKEVPVGGQRYTVSEGLVHRMIRVAPTA